jgi:enoyl-CoA hydratase
MSTPDFSGLTCLSVELTNKVAHIQLCNPSKRNTMVPLFWKELPETVRTIDKHSLARVIVISSQGKHFSAGIDLSLIQQMETDFAGDPARRAEKMRRYILELQDCFSALEQIRIPVLAAIQGGAFGGAVDMICACDCRYATQDAFFTIKETELGLAADVGTLQRIHHLLPNGLVRELAYTSRNMLADEALAFGFVNQVFPDQSSMIETVLNIAKKIATNSPVAVTGTKEMLNYSREHSVQDSLKYMAAWQSGMLQMGDIKKSISAQQEARQPDYEDLHDAISRIHN